MVRHPVFVGETRALERKLWEEIRRLKGSDPLRPITVVAPTGRLVRRLKIEAAREFREGLLAVQFSHLFQFALDCAGLEFRPDPILSERILLRLLRERLGEGAATLDMAGAMRAAIRDLKDAAVPADAGPLLERLRDVVEEEERGESPARLTSHDIRKLGLVLESYAHHEREMRRVGLSDLPDVFREAAERVRIEDPVLVYGFYDLTQIQADFLQAVARQTEVAWFVPGGDGPDWIFSRWFRETYLPLVSGETVRLRAPEFVVPEVWSAVGERDEIRACAKEIRRLLDEGVPADRIAVTARALDPVVRPIEEIFREHCIPIADLPSRPLLEHPLAEVVRRMFRCPIEDYARPSVMEVLLHPLYRVEGDRRHWNDVVRALRIGRDEDWERLALFEGRGYRISSGRPQEEDYRELFVPGEEIGRLRRAVRRLRRHRPPARARWRTYAEFHLRRLAAFGRRQATPAEAGVLAELRAALERLASLETLDEEVTLPEFLEAFEREMRRAKLARPPSGGVAVVDIMGLRGLSFRHVFAVELNARTFPRFIVEEPFLADAVRRRVLRVLGHHLPVRLDGYDEERLLFHLLRSCAEERLVLVYQRADAEGKHRDPSPFLREYRGEVRAVPRGGRGDGILTPRERWVTAERPEVWLSAFGKDAEGYERARRFFEALDGSEWSAFEGRIRGGRKVERLSPTGLERYAGCPFRSFASDVLRLFPYPEREEEDDLTPAEIGTLEHRMLEILYRRMAEAGEDLESEVSRAAREASREFEERTGIRLEGLLAARRDQCARFVRSFAAWDLARRGAWVPAEFEKRVEGEFAGVRFVGKVDRVDRDPSGAFRVIDYKRRGGGDWEKRWDTLLRRATKLQAGLYLEFTGAREASIDFVEDAATGDPDLDEPRKALTLEEWSGLRAETEEGIRGLVAAMERGWYFLRPQEGICGFCDYRTTCRLGYRGLARKAERYGGDFWRVVKAPARRS